MLYPFTCDNCGDKFTVTLSVKEYENFKPTKCNCGSDYRREFTVPVVSFFCGRTIEPHEWNYNKRTGEYEDGHKKTMRKIREGQDIDTV